MPPLPLYLITGLSGAGKSHALQAFEDMGFYCVDNLPSKLLESFLTHCYENKENRAGIALVLDVREGDFVADFHGIVRTLHDEDVILRILFLEATPETLLNRYKESRRPHPLGEEQSLEEAIYQEQEQLQPIRDEADMIIDTSEINIHQFKGLLNDLYHPGSADQFTLSLTSFGFKHGIPGHLDSLFDARFLPNPYYQSDLQAKTGRDPDVVEYLEEDPLTARYLDNLQDNLEMMIEAYHAEGKRFHSVGIGCTGGRHRSVFLTEQLAQRLDNRGDCHPVVVHRDLTDAERDGNES